MAQDVELSLMRLYEGVLYWDSREVRRCFFGTSRFSVARESSRFSRRFSASWSMPLAFGDGSANSL